MKPPLEHSNVAAAYDRWSATYDVDPNRTRDLAGAVLRQRSPVLDGRVVVEIGCGTGRNTLWLAGHARRILALDVSDGMLRRARAHVVAPDVSFLQHDIRTEWPCENGSADVVIAMLVLEHVEQLGPIFAQAARVLRRGGTLFVCELHPMRQMLGRQAEFTDRATGELERVAAFLHDVADYVNGGLEAGLRLTHLGEWRDAAAAPTDPPRLLSVEFQAS